MLFDLTPVLPELFIIVATLVLMVIASLRQEEAGRLILMAAVMVLVIASVITVASDKTRVLAMGGHFVFDGFAAFMKVVIFLGTAAALVIGQGYLRNEKIDRFEFPLLALFCAVGMSVMVSANSLLSLYMGLELQSLPLYVMAAFNRDTLRSTEAGLKYFILGALASGMLLYGCSLVYGFTGTLYFDTLSELFGKGEAGVPLQLGALIGLVFIAAGLAFKLAAVPFHMWTPDVYEGSPTSATVFFATAPKIAAMGLTIRILMEPFGHWTHDWQQIIVFISIASMLLGAFAAIGQNNFKRLMAYSGIGHIGYALVGLASGTEKGVYGVLVYMTIYLVMTLGTFGCILMMRRQGRYVENISELSGLSRRQPMMALALAIFMFSLAGIPPLAGFFGKLYVFLAAVDAGLVPLAVIGLVTSVVGAYYYLRIVKLMYFDPATEPLDIAINGELRFVTAVAAILTLLFIAMPGPLLTAAQAAASALVN